MVPANGFVTRAAAARQPSPAIWWQDPLWFSEMSLAADASKVDRIQRRLYSAYCVINKTVKMKRKTKILLIIALV